MVLSSGNITFLEWSEILFQILVVVVVDVAAVVWRDRFVFSIKQRAASFSSSLVVIIVIVIVVVAATSGCTSTRPDTGTITPLCTNSSSVVPVFVSKARGS